MAKAFKVLRVPKTQPAVSVGSVVYELERCDYGLAADDTRATGEEYRSFTLDPEGGYPFFTMNVRDVEPLLETTTVH